MDRQLFKTHINFETLGLFFFDLANERYPSAEKITQLALRLVEPLTTDAVERLYLQIAVLNAMRDMVKEVSPTHLYRSMQHRDELYSAIIDALEELEDTVEEAEEESLEEE